MNKFLVKLDQTVVEVDADDLSNLDILPVGIDKFHVLNHGKSFLVEVTSTLNDAKLFYVTVNGNKYPAKIEDEYDQLIQTMGLGNKAQHKMKTVKAPMPGLILNILVEPGQEIHIGTPLAILEAMKMENVLKAEGEGVVKVILVNKGTAVDKGQILIEME